MSTTPQSPSNSHSDSQSEASYAVKQAGCVDVIEVEEILERPAEANKLRLLTHDIEPACYRIIAGNLLPVKKAYKIQLRNAVDFEDGDILTLVIRIPTELGDYDVNKAAVIVEFDPSDTPLPWANTIEAYLAIDAKEGCFDIAANALGGVALPSTVTYSCGWVEFKFNFELTQDLSKVCHLEYSICFGKLPMDNVNVKCNRKPRDSKFKYDADACLYIKTHAAVIA